MDASVTVWIATAATIGLVLPVLAADEPAGLALLELSSSESEGFGAAPAAVLLMRGEIWPMDPPYRQQSLMRVTRRVRILTSAGVLKYGQVVIPTGPTLRLTKFEGSTISPHGERVPISKEALFWGESEELGAHLTAVFPRVEVGATLDFHYELRYPTRLDLDPWFFQEGIPVLASELRYHVPLSMNAGVWLRLSPQLEPARSRWSEKRRGTLTFRAKDLAPIVDIPFAPPFADRASQVIVFPIQVAEGPVWRPRLDRWETVADWYGGVYDRASPLPDAVRRNLVARLLSGVAQDDLTKRARELYRFVRDEIASVRSRGIWLQADSSLERVLATRRGSATEKALLLESLMRGAGLRPARVWAGDRNVREIDPELPNPMQLEKLLLRFESRGTVLFLDPSDCRLPFGFLAPENEGVWAVPVDRRAAMPFRLATATADDSRREALIELDVDAAGNVAGRGEVVLSGHHALLGRGLGEDLAQRYSAWVQTLANAFPGFRIQGLHLEESSLEQRLLLRWRMDRTRVRGLADPAALIVAPPAFPAPGPTEVEADRTLPVLLPFASRDDLELRVTWHREWRPDRLLPAVDLETAVGDLRSATTLDSAERRLVYRRTLTMPHRDVGADALDRLGELLAAKQSCDAEAFTFVRTHAPLESRLQ